MRFRDHQRSAQHSSRMLVILFIVLIAGMVVITNAVMAMAWLLGTWGKSGYPAYFFVVNTSIVLVYVMGSYFIELLNLRGGGVQLALEAGGREVTDPQNIYEKRLCNVVMEVAVATGVRPPRIFVLHKEEAINAFVAGWGIQDCVIAVTRGTLERLTRDELQGVVAHEFSHILHGDMRLNMRLMSMVLGLQLLFNLGSAIMMTSTGGRGKVPVIALLGLALMGVGWMGWISGRILSASVSRQREFLADASAVKYTRLSDGIAGALRKIAYQQDTQRAQMQSEKAQNFAPMYFYFKRASKWLATHPPIADRLRKLGFSGWRFEMEDDIQEFKRDVFIANRLIGGAKIAASSKLIPQNWINEVQYARSVMTKDLPPEFMPDFEMADGLQIQQFRAQQRLSLPLNTDQARAAVLAFWVLDGGQEQQELWREQCRKASKKVPLIMLDSVFSLAPQKREFLFERLVTQVQGWDFEDRQGLIESARILAQNSKTPRCKLRLAVLMYCLRENKTPPKISYNKFEQVKGAVVVLTALLAQCLEVPDREKWLQAVCKRIKLGDVIWAEPNEGAVHNAVVKIHKLSLLLTPLLIKVWMHEWEALLCERNVQEQQGDTDTLWLMCALIDCPRPQRLIAWGQEAESEK